MLVLASRYLDEIGEIFLRVYEMRRIAGREAGLKVITFKTFMPD